MVEHCQGEFPPSIRVQIILPTYNEAENLAVLVEELQSLGLNLHMLIVDDNSKDGTQSIARELGERFGNVTLIARTGKFGLGSALKAGLIEALAADAEYIMTMDADCSHDPADVPRLLEAVRSGRADMVQGSRYIRGGGVCRWSVKRRWFSRAANFLYHLAAGGPREYTTNFRILSRRAASVVVDRARVCGYGFVPESTLLVMAAGLTVGEIPITFAGRLRGKSKLGMTEVIKGVTSFLVITLQYRLRIGRFSRRRSANLLVPD